MEKGDADRPGQVRGDRRGLGNDVEVVSAEYLVPTAGHRFLGGGDDTEEHIAQWVAAPDLPGAFEEEGSGTVVQQRRIGRPECGRDGGVALMTRGSDRVVAPALCPQPSGGEVEMAAAQLNIEKRQAHSRRQR
jgi:hypothetical protein